MRKLKLEMQATLDGFVAGPNGEMDFMVWNWDDALKSHVQAITDSVDTVLLGRKTAEGFIPYWAGVAADPTHEEVEAGKFFRDVRKIVFSRTLEESKWERTTIAKGTVTDEIERLKSEEGSDIIAYGGAELVSSLIEADVIDEYNFFVNPSSIGTGLPIFRKGGRLDLKLREAIAFDCGIVALRYESRR
jgi:dihydrofolate reductase